MKVDSSRDSGEGQQPPEEHGTKDKLVDIQLKPELGRGLCRTTKDTIRTHKRYINIGYNYIYITWIPCLSKNSFKNIPK